MRLETLLVHGGHVPDPATGAVSPPIYLSTNFAREADGSLPHGYLYARSENPNRLALERALAPLEGGAVALAFASGMAATTAVFQSLQAGEHVIAPDDAYYGTAKVLREVFGRWGLASSFVNMTDPGAVERAVTPRTRLVWMETPSNPALAVTDIAAVARVAQGAGAMTVCDNTWATPLLQRPMELGADVVMHATTKYLAGHGDVTGGVVVCATDAAAAELASWRKYTGAVLSAHDASLAVRGVRTLGLRMARQCANAAAIDYIGMVFHGVSVTHVDSLTHFFWRGRTYNGKPAHLVSTSLGATACSVVAAKQGFMTRGVLVDAPLVRGVDWLERGEGVMPEDILAAEQRCGFQVEEGDVLLVREAM